MFELNGRNDIVSLFESGLEADLITKYIKYDHGKLTNVYGYPVHDITDEMLLNSLSDKSTQVRLMGGREIRTNTEWLNSESLPETQVYYFEPKVEVYYYLRSN